MSVEIREVPGFGNCLFTTAEFKKGDIFFRECPLMIAKPDAMPTLIHCLDRCHDKQPFGFGHIKSYYSAVRTYLVASQSVYAAVFGKGVSKVDERLTLQEVQFVLAALHCE